jgi:hypothetical protein
MNLKKVDDQLDAGVRELVLGFGTLEQLLLSTLSAVKKSHPRSAPEVFARILYLYSWTRDIDKATPLLREWQRKFPSSVRPVVEAARFYFRAGHPDRALNSLRRLSLPPGRSRTREEVRSYISGLHLKGLAELSLGLKKSAVRTLQTIIRTATRHADEIGTSYELDLVEAMWKQRLSSMKILEYLSIAKWDEFDAPVFQQRATKLKRRILGQKRRRS